jgi:hypothetical protein
MTALQPGHARIAENIRNDYRIVDKLETEEQTLLRSAGLYFVEIRPKTLLLKVVVGVDKDCAPDEHKLEVMPAVIAGRKRLAMQTSHFMR